MSFHDVVPCRLEVQKCRAETRRQYVFAETAGVEYFVRNSSKKAAIVRPVVHGGGKNPAVHPAVQKLAPGETARFVVLMPMGGKPRQRFEVCASTRGKLPGACQLFLAVAVK